MPYENGGFLDYNILTNPPATQYRTIDYNDYVVDTPVHNTVDPGYLNIHGYNFDWNPHIETLDEKLEKFAEKIYMIIREHTHIDISEEEFMKIIKDDD